MDNLMSQKEVKRARILDLLIEGKISQQEASERLGVTTRQVRRLTRRYQAAGLAGLVSKKRSRAWVPSSPCKLKVNMTFRGSTSGDSGNW